MTLLIRILCIVFALLGTRPAFADEVENSRHSVVRIIAVAEGLDGPRGATGTGFAVSPRRFVTNAHVVEVAWNPSGRAGVAIVPPNQKKLLPAEIIAYDADKDLALLEIENASFRPLSVFGGSFRDGANIVALGYPRNVDAALDADLISPLPSVRSGGNFSNISTLNGIEVMLHTAGIARGNSGGPLMDECGRVLGVNTFVTNNDRGDSSFGLAVSTNELRAFLKREGQAFTSVDTECVSVDVAASRAAAAKAQADLAETREQLAETREKDAVEKIALARIQTEREDQMAFAGLIAILGVLSGAFAMIQHSKDRRKPAALFGGASVLLLVLAGYAFMSRPSLDAAGRAGEVVVDKSVKPSEPSKSADAESAAGAPTRLASAQTLVCQIDEGRSRHSQIDPQPVEMKMATDGCVNERTQYAPSGNGAWQRVSVPKTEDVVTRLTFDPETMIYSQERWFADASTMQAARDIKERLTTQSCGMDESGRNALAKSQRAIVAEMVTEPDERLVYNCARR